MGGFAAKRKGPFWIRGVKSHNGFNERLFSSSKAGKGEEVVSQILHNDGADRDPKCFDQQLSSTQPQSEYQCSGARMSDEYIDSG